MATHRYWRVRFTNGGNTWTSVGTMKFQESSDGPDLATGTYATWTESDVGGAGYVGLWRDGSNASFWFSGTTFGSEHWFKGDFGAASGGWPDIRCFTVDDATTGRTNTEWMANGTLEYSDDGSAWTTQMVLTRGGTSSKLWGMVQANITAPATVLSFFGGINSAATAPMPSAVGYCGAIATVQAPTATVLMYLGAAASVTAPMGALRATMHDSTGENAANIFAPVPTLNIIMGGFAKIRAPKPTASASATGTNWLKASAKAPMATLSAAGTVSGTATTNVKAPMASLIGYGGMVCNVTITGRPTLDAHVTSGSVMNANITGPMAILPLFEVTTESFCTADIVAPMGRMGATLQAWIIAPMGTLTAVGTAVVTATYEAYAINLNHPPPRPGEPQIDEVTRYTNFPFTHIVRYQGSYFGANSTGLYLLEGTTDYAETPTAVPWSFRTATTDFKEPKQKTVAAAYFGGRLGPASTVTLYAGEGAGVAYAHTTPRGATAQNHRQVFGKGVKARYYSLGANGTGTMELDDIEFDIHTMTRRI